MTTRTGAHAIGSPVAAVTRPMMLAVTEPGAGRTLGPAGQVSGAAAIEKSTSRASSPAASDMTVGRAMSSASDGPNNCSSGLALGSRLSGRIRAATSIFVASGRKVSEPILAEQIGLGEELRRFSRADARWRKEHLRSDIDAVRRSACRSRVTRPDTAALLVIANDQICVRAIGWQRDQRHGVSGFARANGQRPRWHVRDREPSFVVGEDRIDWTLQPPTRPHAHAAAGRRFSCPPPGRGWARRESARDSER